GQVNFFNDTGLVYIPELGPLGSLVGKGGGHTDYAGNEVYAFDLATRLVSRLTDPNPTLYLDTAALARYNDPIKNPPPLTTAEYGRLYHSAILSGKHWADGDFSTFINGYPPVAQTKAVLQDQPSAGHMFGYQIALPPGFGHNDAQGALLTTCVPSLTPVGSATGMIADILLMTPGADGKRH